jgi:CheY-like chemotaxis protein
VARILVVDDDPLLLELLGDALELAGHDVVTALNGKACYSHLKSRKLPDLITLDCRLPDVSGTTILRSIRANPIQRHIPVIIITASPEDLADVPEELYQALMTKPFPLQDVLRLVDQYTKDAEELLSYDSC